jgi:hypothetical protein
MAVDAISFFGESPSAALVKLLHEKRCKQTESIVRLGSAAFLDWDDAAPIFGKILLDDPTFAEARVYWANRKGWIIEDESERERQFSVSMRDRLTASALCWFSLPACRDPESLQLFPKQIEAAEKLVGRTSPVVLTAGLEADEYVSGYNPQRIKDAIATSAKYPNSCVLLDNLAKELTQNSDGPIDAETAAIVALVAERDLYMPGIGDKRGALEYLSADMEFLGRPDLAALAISRTNERGTYWLSHWCRNLNEADRFAETVKLFHAWRPVLHDDGGLRAAMQTAMAAATIGDDATLQELKHDWGTEFDVQGMSPMLQYLSDSVKGNFGEETRARKIYEEYPKQTGNTIVVVIGAEAEIAAHQRNMSEVIWISWHSIQTTACIGSSSTSMSE